MAYAVCLKCVNNAVNIVNIGISFMVTNNLIFSLLFPPNSKSTLNSNQIYTNNHKQMFFNVSQINACKYLRIAKNIQIKIIQLNSQQDLKQGFK